MKRKSKGQPKPARAKKNAGSQVKRNAKKPAAAKAARIARRRPQHPRPTEPAGRVVALVSANAEALGIPIDAASRSGVTFNLGLILRIAALVDEFPLPDDIEPGPVFHA